jgi:hypothetical protein
MNARASFSERALSYFKKGTTKFSLAPNVYNRNIKLYAQNHIHNEASPKNNDRSNQ